MTMHRSELSARRSAYLRRHSGAHVSEDDKTPHQVATELKREVVQRLTDAARRHAPDDEREKARESI